MAGAERGPQRPVAPVTVRSLQYLLNARGARLAIDGQFGPKTKAAVIGFQRSHGIAASGVVVGAHGGR
jgi:peptidoglycan hydrolase-like protein with peptidoglycan-binding domain